MHKDNAAPHAGDAARSTTRRSVRRHPSSDAAHVVIVRDGRARLASRPPRSHAPAIPRRVTDADPDVDATHDDDVARIACLRPAIHDADKPRD